MKNIGAADSTADVQVSWYSFRGLKNLAKKTQLRLFVAVSLSFIWFLYGHSILLSLGKHLAEEHPGANKFGPDTEHLFNELGVALLIACILFFLVEGAREEDTKRLMEKITDTGASNLKILQEHVQDELIPQVLLADCEPELRQKILELRYVDVQREDFEINVVVEDLKVLSNGSDLKTVRIAVTFKSNLKCRSHVGAEADIRILADPAEIGDSEVTHLTIEPQGHYRNNCKILNWKTKEFEPLEGICTWNPDLETDFVDKVDDGSGAQLAKAKLQFPPYKEIHRDVVIVESGFKESLILAKAATTYFTSAFPVRGVTVKVRTPANFKLEPKLWIPGPTESSEKKQTICVDGTTTWRMSELILLPYSRLTLRLLIREP